MQPHPAEAIQRAKPKSSCIIPTAATLCVHRSSVGPRLHPPRNIPCLYRHIPTRATTSSPLHLRRLSIHHPPLHDPTRTPRLLTVSAHHSLATPINPERVTPLPPHPPPPPPELRKNFQPASVVSKTPPPAPRPQRHRGFTSSAFHPTPPRLTNECAQRRSYMERQKGAGREKGAQTQGGC